MLPEMTKSRHDTLRNVGYGKTFSEFPPQAGTLVLEKAAKLIQKSGKTFSESTVVWQEA
jgi:hypothetical protein